MTAKHVMYGAITADEVKNDPENNKRGDVLYTFTATAPPASAPV